MTRASARSSSSPIRISRRWERFSGANVTRRATNRLAMHQLIDQTVHRRAILDLIRSSAAQREHCFANRVATQIQTALHPNEREHKWQQLQIESHSSSAFRGHNEICVFGGW